MTELIEGFHATITSREMGGVIAWLLALKIYNKFKRGLVKDIIHWFKRFQKDGLYHTDFTVYYVQKWLRDGYSLRASKTQKVELGRHMISGIDRIKEEEGE